MKRIGHRRNGVSLPATAATLKRQRPNWAKQNSLIKFQWLVTNSSSCRASVCVSSTSSTRHTEHSQTKRPTQKKNPNVNKYLNKANTVVAAVDSFIMIMRCDLMLRSIWFLFELLLCSMGRLSWPSQRYTCTKRKEPIFKTKYIMQWTGCKLWCSQIRVRALFHFISSVRLIHSADGGVHACVLRMRVRASTAFNAVLTLHNAYNGFPLLAGGEVKQLLLSINYRSQWCDENFQLMK